MRPLSSKVASPAAVPKFAAEAFSGALTKRPAARASASITLLITRFSTVGGRDGSRMPLRTLILNFRLQMPGTGLFEPAQARPRNSTGGATQVIGRAGSVA